MMAMDAPLKDSQDSPTHANDVGGGGANVSSHTGENKAQGKTHTWPPWR